MLRHEITENTELGTEIICIGTKSGSKLERKVLEKVKLGGVYHLHWRVNQSLPKPFSHINVVFLQEFDGIAFPSHSFSLIRENTLEDVANRKRNTMEELNNSLGDYYAGGFGWMKIPNNIVNGDNKPIEQTNKNNSLHKESFSQVVNRVKSDMNDPSKQDDLTVRILRKFDTPEKQFKFMYDIAHIEPQNKEHKAFPLDKNGNGGR